MKKLLLASTAMLAMAGSALALSNTGTNPACNSLSNQGSPNGFQYCTMNITSATTATQLGRFTIFPTKSVYAVVGVSGTALSGLVSPTFNLYLGNRLVASQQISATTAGTVVNFGTNGVPYFDGLAVSQSTPATISATNSLMIGIIENTRNQAAQ